MAMIKNAIFNEDLTDFEINNVLNKCLQTKCVEKRKKCWDAIRHIILGYQNNDPEMAFKLEICNQDYMPGTFTLDKINKEAKFLKQPISFDNWIDNVLEDELKLIGKSYPNLLVEKSGAGTAQKVKEVLNLMPAGDVCLRDEIWLQEYSDIFHRIIMWILTNNPDFDLDLYPNLTHSRCDFVFKVIELLEKVKNPDLEDWLHLSVASGLLGIDEKPIHTATSEINPIMGIKLNRPGEDQDCEVQRVVEELWGVAKSQCRIDATKIFFHTLGTNNRYELRVVSLPDDYLETIVLLKFYEELLKEFPKLEIDCVPRSVRCGIDASYEDVQNLVMRFSGLQKEKRFRIVNDGPKIGGTNLLKLHPDVMRLISRAFMLDVRGARNYEMMQAVNKDVYFGFMVCRQISESVTGLLAEEKPFIFLRQTPGEYSFKGFEVCYKRQKNERMFAQITVNDQKAKWEGGNLANINNWSPEHKKRYQSIRDFYSNNPPESHWKYGDHLENKVKLFLNGFWGRVLVIGCGSGNEVMHLSQKGCDVFGIDLSSEAIILAHLQYPALKKRIFVEDLYNVDKIMSGKFYGIVANASLIHLLDHDDISYILKCIWDRLERNGLCFIRLIDKEGIKEGFDNYLLGGKVWLVYYTIKELKGIAKRTGFIIEKTDRSSNIQAQSHELYWISMLLRKPGQLTTS